jgi:hypothetical protein
MKLAERLLTESRHAGILLGFAVFELVRFHTNSRPVAHDVGILHWGQSGNWSGTSQ